MLGQAQALGCSGASDLSCLCKNVNFAYGLRDCSQESCPAGTDINAIVSYGNQQCAAGKSAD